MRSSALVLPLLLPPAYPYVCTHPPYETHLVSTSPLVVYLAGFVTPDERAHLLAATHDVFVHSAVADHDGDAATHNHDQAVLHSVRASQSAAVPPSAVVRCIEERALRFQGLWGDALRARVEPLQLVRYGPGEHYHYHTDWFTDPMHATAAAGGNRVSSFFAYVAVSGSNGTDRLRGGGTNFPLLDLPPGATSEPQAPWCTLIDCDEPYDRGVTFRPVAGNAIFWTNLLPGHSAAAAGDPRTLHAGLPVVRGTKVGMNIWTREAALPATIRGA